MDQTNIKNVRKSVDSICASMQSCRTSECVSLDAWGHDLVHDNSVPMARAFVAVSSRHMENPELRIATEVFRPCIRTTTGLFSIRRYTKLVEAKLFFKLPHGSFATSLFPQTRYSYFSSSKLRLSETTKRKRHQGESTIIVHTDLISDSIAGRINFWVINQEGWLCVLSEHTENRIFNSRRFSSYLPW